MPLDPQARTALELLAMMPPIDYSLDGAQVRQTMPVAGGESPFAPGDEVLRIEDVSIPGPGGPLLLRLYHPHAPGALPITLYLHGGGFVFGAPQLHDNICRCLANRAGTLVISVDYRLAPEAKFPAALDDTQAALAWVRNSGAALGDTRRIAIAGDSAGANLAAAVAQQDAASDSPALRHQLLLYPVLDCRFDTASYAKYAEDYFLTREMMRWYWRQYLPSDQPTDDPRVSPLRARQLQGVAAATVITAEYDPLCDEGEAYAKALTQAGVPTSLHRWGGQIHGFASMLGMIDAADQALIVAAQALHKAFAERP